MSKHRAIMTDKKETAYTCTVITFDGKKLCSILDNIDNIIENTFFISF